MSINYINLFKTAAVLPGSFNQKQMQRIPVFQRAEDAVSFSGAAKLTGRNMISAPAVNLCSRMHQNALPAEHCLKGILEEYLSQTAGGINPSITIKTRTKSPDSIREKTISKYSKIVRDEKYAFCKAAVSEIFNYFNPAEGCTKKAAELEAEILMDFTPELEKIPPYNNEKYLLEEIINMLEERRLIRFEEINGIDKQAAVKDMTSRLKPLSSKEHCSEDGSYIDPASSAGIKHYANDIIGARIVLNDFDKNSVLNVFKALKKASDDGCLNITSVENYLPDSRKLPDGSKISDYEYISARKLRKFAEHVNTDYQENISKSGYLAIHINLDLSGSRFRTAKNEFNGYQGEIQIIGSDVENLKEVEDLCYKLKDDKNAFKTKYKPFKEHFMRYYKGEKIKEAFNDYTYKMYLAQRKLPPGVKKDSITFFPSAAELGFKDEIPPELDYNVLRYIKNRCDKDAETKEKENAEKKRLGRMLKDAYKILYGMGIKR